MLAELSTVISSEEANITDVKVSTNIDRNAVCMFEIGVTDLKHLQQVTNRLEQVKGVIEVQRMN